MAKFLRDVLYRSILCLGIGLIANAHCFGGEVARDAMHDSPFAFSAFGTLGLARSSSDTAEYVRDLSQPHGLTREWSGKIDTVLGLQGNWRLSAQTEAVAQVISRYRHDASHDPEVSWFFLSHDFSPDWQLRLGRLGTDFYMLSDSRLIGYSTITVRPSPDFFVPLIFSYFDGVDVAASTNIGSSLLRGKLFYGRSPETTPFFGSIVWNLGGSKFYGGHLDLYRGPWQFRIGHSAVKFSDHEMPVSELLSPMLAAYGVPPAFRDIPQLVPELSMVGKTTSFDSLGVVYDLGPLRVQTMLGRIRHESKSYEDSLAGFVLGSYRIGHFMPYIGYSKVTSTRNRVDAPAILAPFVAELLKIPHMDRHTLTLGTRWDFYDNMALKLQYDRVGGARDSVMTFRGPNIAWDGRMDVLSVSLDFAF